MHLIVGRKLHGNRGAQVDNIAGRARKFHRTGRHWHNAEEAVAFVGLLSGRIRDFHLHLGAYIVRYRPVVGIGSNDFILAFENGNIACPGIVDDSYLIKVTPRIRQRPGNFHLLAYFKGLAAVGGGEGDGVTFGAYNKSVTNIFDPSGAVPYSYLYINIGACSWIRDCPRAAHCVSVRIKERSPSLRYGLPRSSIHSVVDVEVI